MNDHILTKLRQEEQRKYGIQKGFPIHALVLFKNTKEFEVKAFFTYKGLQEYLDGLDSGVIYTHKIVHANDVKKVSFET